MDVYRVLMIGSGFGRRVQIPVMQAHPRFTVTAVASAHADRAAAAAEEFGVPAHGDDWRALIGSEPVDVVSVVTPVVNHAEQALAAVEAGKHLLLEKPAALDRAEAGRIALAADRAGVHAAINHEFRYRPDVLTLRRMLVDGRLGELRGVETRDFFRFWSDPGKPSWIWLCDRSQGGGLLGAIGSHSVDMVRFITGRDVVAAQGQVWTVHPERPDPEGRARPVTADDSAAYVLELEGGVRVNGSIAAAYPYEEQVIRVFAEKGTVTLDGSWSLRWQDASGEERVVPPDEDLEWSSDEPDIRRPLMHRLLDRFARRMDGETVDDLATLEEGVQVMAALDAVRAGSGAALGRIPRG